MDTAQTCHRPVRGRERIILTEEKDRRTFVTVLVVLTEDSHYIQALVREGPPGSRTPAHGNTLVPEKLQPPAPPRDRGKLYVVLSVVLCLLASSLLAFFMFPRSLLIEDDGIRTVTVLFDRNNSKVIINMTSTLNISNSNFFTALVDSVSCQVLYMNTVIGTQQLDNVISILPLSQRQMNFTVNMEISGSLFYVYAFCTMASIKVHNIVVFMQTSVKTSYMVRTAQNTLEVYRYIDCGANYTVRQTPWLL
ncbi:hypothetical protein COCON_G00146290 [Conger conger]|uniref:Transmembrane protein 106 C-terminal domain-containing protein n=1 Tax=Conger conger TaxID=82655 RepID=A0A9Q1DCA6_CONCO|nr:hypothetical protein COCON_G00146290 [Conger conger]